MGGAHGLPDLQKADCVVGFLGFQLLAILAICNWSFGKDCERTQRAEKELPRGPWPHFTSGIG